MNAAKLCQLCAQTVAKGTFASQFVEQSLGLLKRFRPNITTRKQASKTTGDLLFGEQCRSFSWLVSKVGWKRQHLSILGNTDFDATSFRLSFYSLIRFNSQQDTHCRDSESSGVVLAVSEFEMFRVIKKRFFPPKGGKPLL